MHYPDHFNSLDTFLGITTGAWTAIATLFAVMVALFQEWIKDIWDHATLKMEIISSPPDTHQIYLGDERGLTSKCLYIRIRVTHLKGKSAEDIEIMATNFWEVNADGSKKKISSFLPMNLKWSHFQPSRTNIRVPKGLFRHCDFGRIEPGGDMALCKLQIDTMVQPNPVSGNKYPNIILPGKYEFELMLTGSNTKVLKQCWQLEFENKWSGDEDAMLRYLKIKDITCI